MASSYFQQLMAVIAAAGVGGNPWLIGATSGNLARLRAQRTAVAAGTDELRALIVGDSNVAGAGAGTSGSFLYAGARARNWPTRMAEKLTSTHGLPSQNAALIGMQKVNAQQSAVTYDPRVTPGSFVIWDSIGPGGDGWTIGGAAPAGAVWTFAPGETFDQIRVKWLSNATHNNCSLAGNGSGALVTLTGQVGSSAAVQDSGWVTCPSGNGSLTITTLQTGAFPILSVETRLVSVPKIRLLQAGWAGAKVFDQQQQSVVWHPANMIDDFAPHLVIIAGLTINDANTATTEASWRTNMGNLLNKCSAANADVLLTTGLWLKNANGTVQAASEVLQTALRDIATTRGLPYVEMHNRWRDGAFDTTSAYYDALHPSYSGYQDWSDQVANVIATA